jgi:uncharacterized DUF497 family protein
MSRTEYCWNNAKAASNKLKHGVSFLTASKAMSDPYRLDEADDDIHGETRWRSLALADGVLILLIVNVTWDEGETEVIRIISARPATREEGLKYEQNRIQNAR